MRIAYFVNEYPKVSHTFIRREILALEKQGVEIVRFALRANLADLPDPEDQAEFKKTCLLISGSKLTTMRACLRGLSRSPLRSLRLLFEVIRGGWRSRAGMVRHIGYLLEAAALRCLLKEAAVTHVHAHFGTNPANVVMLCRRLGGPPYSLTIHGCEEFDRPEELMLREKVHHAAFVAVVSSFTRSQVFRWADNADWSKVAVVRCALEPEYFAGANRVATQRPRFLCVGRISKEKGQIFLLKAARSLADRTRDFEVVLAGDGPLRANIEEQIRTLELQDHVSITGWIDNTAVRNLMASTHALVVPSLAEGLPIVIMEAFALRTPVISSCVAGVPELVEPGKSGWLVPSSDHDALAEAMADSLEAAPETIRAMGEHGYGRTIRQHQIDKEASLLRDLFQKHRDHTSDRE